MNSPPEAPHPDFVASADWNEEFSNYIKTAQKVTLKFTSIEELEKTVSELTGLSEIEILLSKKNDLISFE